MDAEFPGIVARPIGNFAGSKAEYHYQTLRCNVDILKPIQIGITLWTSEGDLCPSQDPAITNRGPKSGYSNPMLNQSIPCTWVFNFDFNLETDMYAESSIELLKGSGVDFQRHAEMGVSHTAFGALLTTSGLAFSPDVHWLSFHSGYDFGYLIKLLSDNALPADQTDFFSLVTAFFPKLWDIKYLLRHAQRLRAQGRMAEGGMRVVDSLGTKSGLNDLAEELGCQRVGQSHTAGSDAWLTGAVFWSMKSQIFGGLLEEELSDMIYGLHGVPLPASQQYREEFFAAQGTPGGAGVNGLGGLSGLGGSATASFTPGGHGGNNGHNPSTPVAQHAGLHSGTPGGGGRDGGLYTAAQHNMGGGFAGFQYGQGK
jgi:CCR4-NOT transcription complex subunit 7/8